MDSSRLCMPTRIQTTQALAESWRRKARDADRTVAALLWLVDTNVSLLIFCFHGKPLSAPTAQGRRVSAYLQPTKTRRPRLTSNHHHLFLALSSCTSERSPTPGDCRHPTHRLQILPFHSFTQPPSFTTMLTFIVLSALFAGPATAHVFPYAPGMYCEGVRVAFASPAFVHRL